MTGPERSRAVAALEGAQDDLLEAAMQTTSCFRKGGKLLIFGNGGSAAQAQHLAAEFVGRLTRRRAALPAIALSADGVMVTSLANDFGFASAWDMESYEFLRSFNPTYNKVASAMITRTELLEAIAADGRHTFISTGMSTPPDIDRAVKIFRAAGCPFELMHCVSAYPTADEDANLMAIPALKAEYGCDVGYSGHEVGMAPSYEAAALGISSLERHITLDREMYGSDQAASLDPQEFRTLVAVVRQIDDAMAKVARL